MKKLILAVSMMFCSLQVFAIGHVSNAKVVQVRVDLDGRAMIIFDQQVAGTPPNCVHVAYKNAFAVDASTDGGKAVLSWALTAKTTGAPVTVYGFGVCGVYGGTNVETWNYGVMY